MEEPKLLNTKGHTGPGERKDYEPEPVVGAGSLEDLTKILAKKLTKQQLKTVKEIGYTIGTSGLAIGDACLLARCTTEDIERWSEQVPEIRTYLRLREVQYKYDLLQIVNSQAIDNKDVKQATWLLEQHFAEDYNPTIKKELEKMKRNSEEDIVALAISVVRKTGTHSMPVNEEQQKAEEAEKIAFKDITEVLS